MGLLHLSFLERITIVAENFIHFYTSPCKYCTLEDSNYDNEKVQSYVKKFNDINSVCPKIFDEESEKMFTEYSKYKEDTLDGKHGKTPQIYLMFVKFYEYFLQLQHSIRTSDLQLFQHVLSKMGNLFFIMNHQNYARYIPIYLNTIENIDKTHPGLLDDCGNCF